MAATAFALMSVAAPPAVAQEEEAIDEIQVTATRRPVAAAKVSAALTVVARDDISNEKLATDALASEVGVYLQQTTVGQGAAIIRGLKGSEILHLVDGLRLNNAIFRNAPTQYLSLVAPGSIERMEVVRGSPTSLYGSDAVGGVIQVISRLPRFDDDRFQVSREVAAGVDSAELGKSLRGSLEFGNRERAALVSAAWQESGNRRTGSGERVAPSGFESYSARTAFVLRPDESQSWVADLQFTRQPETPRVDELVPGFGETEPASSEFFFAPNERYFARLRHTRDDGWLQADWTIDAGWQRINDDRRSRNFGAPERTLEKNRSDLYGVSVNATRDLGLAAWVVGVEAYHDTVHSSRVEVDISSGVRSERQSRFPDGASVQQRALFANVSRPFGDRHALAGGVRVSSVDIDLTATTVSDAADISINDASADLGWVFDVSDTVQLAANLGHGFRAPNIFDLGTLGERPGNRFNIPNPALESERVTQYDIGLRRRAATWSGEIVAYQLDYTDRIQSALTGTTTPDGRDIVQSRNLGEAEIYGLEAGLRWHPAGPWSGEVLVNLTRGEQREEDGSLASGDRIPPVNGRLRVQRDIDDRLRLTASLNFADEQLRLSPRDVRDNRIDPSGTPGWGIAAVGVTWTPDDVWRISAGVDNLLDKRYRVHGSGIDAPGRNVYVTAMARW